ncbi:MAG: SCO family protein [Sandaracinaceae bacterium]|nr:SCO family protein [Sandaracinaceae bacterium]
MRAVSATLLAALVALTLSVGATVVRAQAGIRPVITPGTGGAEMILRDVGVAETYETPIPADATFRDHTGQTVTFGELWRSDRPAILQFVYYQCATTCDVVLLGTTSVLIQQPRSVGIDVDVYTISMDPRDTPAAAADARGRALGRYGRAEAADGWHFLVGDEAQIQRVAAAVGYRYRWDEASQQFAHPALMMILRAGPQARVGRYLYGIEQSPNDVRIGLAEAADGRTVDAAEAALLYCFQYDAQQGRYVVMAWRIMRIGGGLTALILVSVLLMFWRNELRARRGSDTTSANSRPESVAR